MAETLSTISIISFIAAGVFAVTAIALWFIFKIPTVAGDLSGKNARKSVERIRKSNESKLTGTKKDTRNNIYKSTNVETGLLNENKASTYQSSDTGLLKDGVEPPLERKTSSIKITMLEEKIYIHTKAEI